jgi:hypothetical protein
MCRGALLPAQQLHCLKDLTSLQCRLPVPVLQLLICLRCTGGGCELHIASVSVRKRHGSAADHVQRRTFSGTEAAPCRGQGSRCVPCWCRVLLRLQVTVHYPTGRQQLVTYRQAFTGAQALCLQASRRTSLHLGLSCVWMTHWAELCVDDTLENAAAPHDTATLLALLADCPPFLTAHPASMCCCATAAKPPCLCAGGGPDGPPLVRHCINCFRAVEGAVAAEDAVLQGALDLFCSLDCERSWSIKSSSGEGPCGCLEPSDRTGMSQELSRHSCTCDRPLECASCGKPFAPVGTPGGWFRCTKVCGVAHELACGVVPLRFRWHPSCAVQA